MLQAPENLTNLIGRTVTDMGYELVGVEYQGRGGSGALLRVYIDSVDGITVDDCADVSHQLSGVLDVEDPIREEYDLEISSPGLDRPLFTRAHYESFVGSRVTVKLRIKLDGRRRFEGILKGVDDDAVLVEGEDGLFKLPLSGIEKARLIPEF